MGINDVIIIIDTRLIVQVGLDVDACSLDDIRGCELVCHRNKVINNYSQLMHCVHMCVCVYVCRESHGPDIATLHNIHLLLDLVWQTVCFQKCKIEKIQLCKSTKLKKIQFYKIATINRKFETSLAITRWMALLASEPL